MALRPFARHPKKSEEETTQNESNGVSQFFSSNPRPEDPPADDARSNQMTAGPAPAITVEVQAAAGWYPDAANAGLMRYWDGFHFTGQIMHVHARAGEAEVSAPIAASAHAAEPSMNSTSRAADLLAPSRSQRASLDEPPITGRSAPPTPSSERDDPAPSATPAVAVTSFATDYSPQDQPVDGGETGAAVFGIGRTEAKAEVEARTEARTETQTETETETETEAKTETGKEAKTEMETGTEVIDKAEADEAVSKSDDVGNEDATSPKVGSPGVPSKQKAPDEANNWAEQTERAVARATAIGTPEAWQEAAQVAVVVSEMAQTMQAAADATQVAVQMDRAAEDAAQGAHVAAKAAEDANQSVQQTARAAQEAAEAARVAEQAAADAKETAEQSAQAVPRIAEVAKVAAQAATEARRMAQRLEEIVAKACTANTPEDWSEALKLASVATETQHVPSPSSHPWG
jgi:hypothetical protein